MRMFNLKVCRIFGIGQNIHLTALYDFLFLRDFFQEAGPWQIFVENQRISDGNDNNESILCWGKHIFDISLFSCDSGKQGCDRYLLKTQRISNDNDNNENNEIILYWRKYIFDISLYDFSVFVPFWEAGLWQIFVENSKNFQ